MTGANMNTEKEKVRQLLLKGKEKGSLSYEEIMDSLATTELSPEQIDDIYEQIETFTQRKRVQTGRFSRSSERITTNDYSY